MDDGFQHMKDEDLEYDRLCEAFIKESENY